MDGKGRCMDNIFVERLWRNLKYEELYLHAYARVAEAKARASSEGGEILTFAHIPTGTTVDKAIDVDDSKSRGVAPATALTMMGADIETGRATP
jgi:transposase InsO family protein